MHSAGFIGKRHAPWQEERDRVFDAALAAGWCAAGTATVDPFPDAEQHLLDAIRQGRLTGMDWMHERRAHAAAHLDERFPWAKSIIALAWPYPPGGMTANPAPGGAGRIASYALLRESGATRAEDYHSLLERKCRELVQHLRTTHPDCRAKIFVDHGWAVDRAIAERAGIGFIGKNACLITPHGGSFVLLASIVTSLPFPPTAPSRKSCGSCTACMSGCPTGAILSPGVIDSRKCISYWTIEHEGDIPEDIRPLLGDWIFGCDLCQDVCPINGVKALPGLHAGGELPSSRMDLVQLLFLDDGGFLDLFAGTPVERTGRIRLVRNVVIALGNVGTLEVLPHLATFMESADGAMEELAAWAVMSIRRRQANPARLPLH